MTDADFGRFSAALTTLAGRLSSRPIEGDRIAEAFQDVKAYPWLAVERALDGIRKTARFFPRPAQLIDACREAAVAIPTDIPSWIDHQQGRFFCADCDDTGFVRRLECPGDGSCRLKGCGEYGVTPEPHPFTRACSCRAQNPILCRQREIAIQQRPNRNQE